MTYPSTLLAAGAALLFLTPGAAGTAGAPCLRLSRAGTQVQGDVRICPGRYRIADRAERGVIILAGSATRLTLTGVTLESGDSVPGRFAGIGVAATGVDGVTIVGGTVRGYRYNVRIEGGRGHRVSGVVASGSRRQALKSTPTTYDEADWLDIFHPDTFEAYGAGIYLRGTEGASVTGVTARDAQNGIGLFDARYTYLADNDVSNNTGWGINLWRSSHNVIVRNRASRNVRCESPHYSRGCDSAALLLRERSDSNVIAENDLTYSGDGFFLSGHRPYVQPSVGNLVMRNDATGAYHNAFESTFSWNNAFLDNRADSSAYGFWLGYSSGNVVRGNSIVGTRRVGIAIEHGSDNTIGGNVVIGGGTGIRLFAPKPEDAGSRGYRIDDNTLANLEQGLVLERTTQTKLRGNLFDGVTEALVVDEVGRETEVTGNIFLRARRYFIRAADLEAGGNYWGAADAAATHQKIAGRVSVEPWRAAREAGY